MHAASLSLVSSRDGAAAGVRGLEGAGAGGAGGVAFNRIDGSMRPAERSAAVARFNAEPSLAVCLLSTGVGAHGLTLTAATLVVYYGNSWALEMREQSEDRAHRRGQKNAVLYVDLIAEGSVDELVIDALKNKRDVADYVRDLIQEKAAIRGFDNE